MQDAIEKTLVRMLALLPLALLASCTTLEKEPWADIGKGSHQLGVSTGWAVYQADVLAEGKSGVLKGQAGKDTVDLIPRFGAALKYSYYVTDHLALGGIAELRSFDPDGPIKPLSANLSAHPFETVHLILSSRWWFDPIKQAPRFKPFVGLDVAWVPEVDLGSVTVNYPPGSGIPSEKVKAKGSDYWTIAPVVGASYLLKDWWSLDFGAFYEFPLTQSEETLTFKNLGGAQSDVFVEPQGLIGFVGFSFFF